MALRKQKNQACKDNISINRVASHMALVVKNLPANAGDIKDMGLIPGLERFPWRREWQPTSLFLPGKSLGLRSLAGS